MGKHRVNLDSGTSDREILCYRDRVRNWCECDAHKSKNMAVPGIDRDMSTDMWSVKQALSSAYDL